MRLTQFFLNTLREAPSEAELISHQLMIRAGLIKKLGSGLYSWMPLGLRVLRKIESIIREEMNRSGAIELLMPAVQPAELWNESGRWDLFGPQMLKITDRHDRSFCFGPTHEEVITDIARQDIRSYKQLPINLYQIQTKFRDEIRPRFGVMRAREFIMKDAYSFHATYDDLQREYENMHQTYCRVFDRLGLRYRSVAADTGAIGGSGSHEFHVLADSGEDTIAYCSQSDYAANVELAEALPTTPSTSEHINPIEEVETPGSKRCEDVARQLDIPLSKIVKTIAVVAEDQFTLLLLRGDRQLNEIKASKITGLATLRLATDTEIKNHLNCVAGYIGPVGIPEDVRVIGDFSVEHLTNFTCGANKEPFHYVNTNWRDIKNTVEFFDIRNVEAGDESPDKKGTLDICRGIEVGHIFQLRTKYSEALGCQFLDDQGKSQPAEMGCYGIGVSRIVAAAIEQGHDDRGIIWPLSMAPFVVAIAAIGYTKSSEVKIFSDTLHQSLEDAGFDVLLDDRGERPGVMFADLELIGIPFRLTVGERGLKDNGLEWTNRRTGDTQKISAEKACDFIIETLSREYRLQCDA